MARFKKEPRMEFSKKLAIIMTLLFVITVLFSLFVWLFQNRVPSEVLSYVAAPFSIVITGYFAKSGVENYQKINYREDERDERFNV